MRRVVQTIADTAQTDHALPTVPACSAQPASEEETVMEQGREQAAREFDEWDRAEREARDRFDREPTRKNQTDWFVAMHWRDVARVTAERFGVDCAPLTR